MNPKNAIPPQSDRPVATTPAGWLYVLGWLGVAVSWALLTVWVCACQVQGFALHIF